MKLLSAALLSCCLTGERLHRGKRTQSLCFSSMVALVFKLVAPFVYICLVHLSFTAEFPVKSEHICV